MITIGLTTWKEHPALINDEQRDVTLSEYAAVLPVVEVDTPFYGIPRVTTVQRWQQEVPAGFQFILKANKVMTKHDYGTDEVSEADRQQAFVDFRRMVQPLVTKHQLKAVLFQFPPFFRRSTENLEWLVDIRRLMGDLPIAVEFRNPTWYDPALVNDVMTYLKQLHMTHVIVDEPHRLNDGMALLPQVTSDLAILRLHGRNEKGWFNQGKDWRGQRTLYRYSDAELAEFGQLVTNLSQQAKDVCVIFNNNSGGDAAPNALALRDLLGIHWTGLGPQQMSLF
ncbi:DUF72 domain-containing protein [Secundilactobacillus similis DSM 23365 = JCM 2765]|uniref:DUF72 domain-containing protein n=1 Tax=Secundilactobacillus similis DSM 23365 = JCM 2765 TaxID=1423804 RepID=A0A0R2F194_9LACO|nr:DUF72 domain-containing protein [Secundilactobacillus similis]KRN18189.1 hypothetical protein FD14_GL002204 [Secundilactobacillus similis DSM 23365 = JCM 2765]